LTCGLPSNCSCNAKGPFAVPGGAPCYLQRGPFVCTFPYDFEGRRCARLRCPTPAALTDGVGPIGLSEWAWWGDLRPELVRGLALASLSPSGWTLPHRPVFPILIGYPDPSGPHLLGDGVGPTRPKTSSRGSEGLVGALLRALHNALPVWFRYTLEGPKLC
jgi:hypothetical protein